MAIDSAGVLNLGTTSATSISLGKTGITTTNNGGLSILGNYSTPKGTDYTTTGSQNNVDLGTGSYFLYAGAGTATFTGIAGGTDGRQIRITNSSASDLTITNQDSNSTAANRVITPSGTSVTIAQNVTVGLQYDAGASRWRVVTIPASASAIAGFGFLQSGNAFGATASLGTTDANALNFITGGATRFTIAAGSNTLTGNGATTITTGSGALTLDAAATLNLGTTNATSLSVGRTGITTTNNGSLTSTQTLTASNGLTLTTGVLNLSPTSGTVGLSSVTLSGASPLVFDGATADSNKTTFAFADPTGSRTITFPNNSITINAAADITGTTLASNVVTSSLTSVGALTTGSIASGFTSINGVPIGASSANTGRFTTLTSTGATDIANAGASNVTIATSGTGNVTIGNSTGTFALTSNGGLNVTAGGALTGIASVNTITTSGTGLTFAGTGAVSSTGANALTIDGGSSGLLNLNNNSTGNILLGGGSGSTGCTLTNSTGAFACTAGITGSNLSGINTGDQTTISGNAGTATALQTARTINGVSFDGTGNITITSAAGTLTGATLNSGVTDSSLSSVGALSSGSIASGFGSISTTNNITTSANISSTGSGTITSAGTLTGSSDINVTGKWTGNVSTTATVDSGTLSTISTKALAYFVSSSDTTGTCASGSKTFNITGLSNTEGAYAYIVTKAIDGGCSSSTLTLTLSINGTTISTVANANTNGTVTENYVVAYINGAWRILGTPSTADGADIAETYSTNDESIEAGDVVSLDSSLISGVKKTKGVGDKRVIGIVSTMPAMVIGSANNEGVTAVPVALSGRVPVKVNAENGAIEPGDYLSPSSVPGIAMKSNNTGVIIGQAMSPYSGDGAGIVLAFIKNFDMGDIEQTTLLLGEVSPKAGTDGIDNGLATLVTTIQSEIIRDPIMIIGKNISDGKQFLTNLIAARVTAIRGYFDEVFTKKIHTEQLCMKKTDGSEVCVTGDQLDTLLQNANVKPIMATPITPPPSSSSKEEPVEISTPDVPTGSINDGVTVPIETPVTEEVIPPEAPAQQEVSVEQEAPSAEATNETGVIVNQPNE